MSTPQEQQLQRETAQKEAAHQLAVQRERATQDLGDIEGLQNYTPFNRYWVGRLNALFHSKLTASRKGGTPEAREQARIEANLLEELTQIPANDKKSCQAMLANPPQGMAQPRQVT